MEASWIDALNAVGPFVSLTELKSILANVPAEEQNMSEYHWLEGLIMGRSIFEEFGGIA